MNIELVKRLVGKTVWVNFIVDPAPPENFFKILDVDDDGDWISLLPVLNDKVDELIVRVADIDYMIVRNPSSGPPK